jgi:hypothetical protein
MRAAAVTAVVLVAGAVGWWSWSARAAADPDPYDGLSPAAAAYVIPGSEGWGPGEWCPGGGDCGAPMSPENMADHRWLEVAAIEAVGGEDTEHTISVVIEVVPPIDSPGGSGTEELSALAWGPDLDPVQQVLEEHEVWVGIDERSGYAVRFVAFDRADRFAGVGQKAEAGFTVPMATAAAEADAESGRAFIEPLMAPS